MHRRAALNLLLLTLVTCQVAPATATPVSTIHGLVEPPSDTMDAVLFAKTMLPASTRVTLHGRNARAWSVPVAVDGRFAL